MELRHLRYFRAAARTQHMGRAAESLHIAQPALSMQVQALEAELGVRLFERRNRAIVLTAAGTAFLAEAEDILTRVERAGQVARDTEAGVAGTLRIGFTESASYSPVVIQALKAYRAASPAVALVLEEAVSDALAESVAQGRLDLAFVRPPIQSGPPSLLLDPLGDEALEAAMPLEHPLARRKAVRLRELADADFIFRGRITGIQASVQAACREAGFSPRTTQQAPQLSAVINLVAASLGIAIVPQSMRVVRHDRVAFVPIADLAVRAQLGILRRAAGSAAADRFLQLAREAARPSAAPAAGRRRRAGMPG